MTGDAAGAEVCGIASGTIGELAGGDGGSYDSIGSKGSAEKGPSSGGFAPGAGNDPAENGPASGNASRPISDGNSRSARSTSSSKGDCLKPVRTSRSSSEQTCWAA